VTVGPVVYAGEPGAFAEDAVLSSFGDVDRTGLPGFREVFEEVTLGDARAGVVPIENLVNGSVREVFDLLLAHELRITGEVIVPVELCLAALPGQTLDDIERVYSHIQALGQAERFLRSRPWTLLTTYNTAGSGRLIADAGERGAGALLSARAAERFGLEVLVDRVQDVADNRTRFLLIARSDADVTESDVPGSNASASKAPASNASAPDPSFRTTLAFAVTNEPGSLLRALQAFADRDVNLSSLESRPSRTAAWEYVFWADVDAAADRPAAAAAIADLRRIATMVRVFGSYPRAAPG
jgi:prephenate dehydratase